MKMQRKCTIYKKKIILGCIFMAMAIVMYLLAKSSEYIAEYIFARGFYRIFSAIINNITGIFPFSIIEIIVLLLPAVFIGSLGYCLFNKEKRKLRIKKFLSNIILIVGIISFLYMSLCGVNYYRYSFAKINNIEMTGHSDEQLYKMCLDLADRMNNARVGLPQKEGVIFFEESSFSLAEIMEEEFFALTEKYKGLNPYVAEAKPLMISYIFSCFETTGIYSPFTVEANVNVDIPDYQIPYTMAHEMAHVSGFMREDEANFIAYLVCTNSTDQRLVYSGLSLAFSHSVNKLYQANPEYYYDVWDKLSEEVVTDRNASREYWKRFENTKASQVAGKINDNYLKANNQEDGTKSYGRMVDLLLSTYFD